MRCCLCDYDSLAPSPFSTSVISGSKAGQVRYRPKLKDNFCPGCYQSVVSTIITTGGPDIYDEDPYLEAYNFDFKDFIRTNSLTMPMRGIV